MAEHPYWVEGEARRGRWLVTCDHATNRVPDCVGGGDLGVAAQDMARHIAYDVGAAGVASKLGALLDSPAIFADFSRLVIDPNRGEDDPTLVMKLYDGTIIPANRQADAEEVERRLATLYRPYHAALARLAHRDGTVLCAVHSFTKQFEGRPERPWDVALLYAHDERVANPLLALLRQERDLCVGANQPYSGHLPGDSIARHGLEEGRPNILIEIRNDLIETPEQQAAWATRLAPLLAQSLIDANI